MTPLLLSLLLAAVGEAKTYRCQSEFGETLPLKKQVLMPGERCGECKDVSRKIPLKQLDASLSASWNEKLGEDPRWTTTVKRKEYVSGKRQIFLDTRYATHAGPSFRLELNCESGAKCQGKVLDLKAPYRLEASPVDTRLASRGYAELTLGRREHLGLIVRVFKEAVPGPGGTKLPVSASGELKFFREDPLFVQDVGVDEQLFLLEDFSVRNAALEVKIRCEPAAG